MDLNLVLKGLKGEVSAKEVKSLLSKDGPLLQMLALIEQTAAGKADNLVNADLSSDEGRLHAVKTQGEIRGLRQAIEIIGDLAEEDNNG